MTFAADGVNEALVSRWISYVIVPPHEGAAGAHDRAVPQVICPVAATAATPAKRGGMRQPPVAVAETASDAADTAHPLRARSRYQYAFPPDRCASRKGGAVVVAMRVYG